MNKIKLLDDSLINKIAAGEVIDRPSSVVKELVENSIDAQSTKIMIYIEGGGTKKIQVRDNGIGIEKNSISMAFKRHATSKISKNNDLFNINTLGFRGEALPSIGSISRVLIESSHNKSDGYSTNINYGKIDEIQPSSISTGTNIVITDLFTNVPARMKFLKTEKFAEDNSNIKLQIDSREIIVYKENFLIDIPESDPITIKEDEFVFEIDYPSIIDYKCLPMYCLKSISYDNSKFVFESQEDYNLIPVKISKKNMKKVLSIAYKAHKLLRCRGVTRSDFKFFKNKFYLLELNTQPGMTKLSLVPEIAANRGINFIGLIEWILKDASINR